MEVTEIKRIYAYYSRVYDFIFKRWFFPRQQHAIASLHIDPGQHILDVGVGTGLSLPLYPRHAHVVGVDLSSKMLREAQKKSSPKAAYACGLNGNGRLSSCLPG
jgi:phosphatidylethanolamine/phosphatidyl-N-methylethanolamine N-methyltransferase